VVRRSRPATFPSIVPSLYGSINLPSCPLLHSSSGHILWLSAGYIRDRKKRSGLLFLPNPYPVWSKYSSQHVGQVSDLKETVI
jgi:hypothetical protein